MGKAQAVGEAIIVLKEIFDFGSSYFSETIPSEIYKLMDKLAFLNSGFLGINSKGEILDKVDKMASAILNLTNIVMWGILLFYGFKSLFSYFLSKHVDVPWKFFVRMIVFGILANASFFICYTGVFFAENCTDYIRSYVGEDKISFSFLEEHIATDLDNEQDENDIYNMDFLISVFLYFITFFTAVCLGGRYLLIRMLILLSPLFFLFGGLKCSEKIFYKWCKNFFVLLFMQIFFCCVLGIVNSLNMEENLFSQILICSCLFILCKNVLSFFNFMQLKC